MLPLRDELPTRTTPWVTRLLILANLAIFLATLGATPEAQAILIERWGVVPARLLATPRPDEWATLLTSQFLHAGWIHLLGNLLVLWIFGNNVEDRLGHGRFLAFYLACGTAAGLAQVLSGPGSIIPGIGASGAIAGVLAAYLRWYPGARVVTVVMVFILPWFVRLPAILVIGGWFLLQVVSGVAALDPAVAAAGGVAWWAHIGGFLAGLVLAPLLAPPARRWGAV